MIPAKLRTYRMESAIVEEHGGYEVHVAAVFESGTQGTISQRRHCDSLMSAELTRDFLMEQVQTAVRAIGAAIDYSDGRDIER